ncbi:MAG: hypothetical protein FJX56_08340 [Alphaproteobacteria bacterium]|nr:hypothetical protein [Alphaproteobacteria bacterium]
MLLRLPLEIKDLFEEWLAAHAPLKSARVMKLIHESRGGAAYQSAFGLRMRGSGPYAEQIRRRFHLACDRFGLNKEHAALDTTQFRPPTSQFTLL